MARFNYNFDSYTLTDTVAVGDAACTEVDGTPEYVTGLNSSTAAIELDMSGDGVAWAVPRGDFSIQVRVRADDAITGGAYRILTLKQALSTWITLIRFHNAPRIDVADSSGTLVEDGGTDWVVGTEYIVEVAYNASTENIVWREKNAAGTLVHTYADFDATGEVPAQFTLGTGDSGTGAGNTVTYDDLKIADNANFDFDAPTTTSPVLVEEFDWGVPSDGATYMLATDVGSLNSAFVRMTAGGSFPAGSGKEGETGNLGVNHMIGVSLTDTDTLTGYTETTGVLKSAGEVWRYVGPSGGPHEFIVRGRYALTISSGNSSVTQTLTGVSDRNNCIPIISGTTTPTATGTGDYDAVLTSAHINSSGSLVVSRNNTNSVEPTVYVQVVEFTGSAWSVGHGISSSHDSAAETVTLNTDSTGSGGSTFDVSNWSNAMIIAANMEGDTAESGIGDIRALVEPAAGTTQIIFSIVTADAAARNDGDAHIHVLHSDDLTVYRESNNDWAEGNNTYATLAWPTSAPANKDFSELSWEWFCDTSGVGSAHLRGAIAPIKLLENDVAKSEGWVHRSGNTIYLRYGIVDLSGLEFGSTGPDISNVYVWDGTQKIAADAVSVWDGTQKITIDTIGV